MDSDRDSERLFSLRLSRVMGDIGVNSWMIARRRRTYLRIEKMENVHSFMRDENATIYIFGSQSEATTTLGIESDIDQLICDNNEHISLDWSEWQYGKLNLLVLKNELTPPQHCYLHRLRYDRPLSAVQTLGPDDVLDGEGRVLLTNIRVRDQDIFQSLNESGVVLRHGPSMSNDEKRDYVDGYHCGKLPKECQFMFNRPRPGHWPRPDILNKARQTGVFLVPQGYTESPAKQSKCKSTAFMVPSKLTNYPYSKWQWRFSTSLMERCLMFDFNTVQVKVYTLTKILRKTYFKPVFGDRFSTFHIKTAMMFTIENYPVDMWREDNIVKCVCLLLTTLKRWLKQKLCPHFTISGVNLLVGKLHSWELPKLSSIISNLINTKLLCLFYTDMDNIGLRLLQCSSLENIPCLNVSTRTQTCGAVLHELLLNEMCNLTVCTENIVTNHSVADIVNFCLSLQSMSISNSDLGHEVFPLLIPFLRSTVATVLTSMCIYLGQPITQDIFHWYQLSLNSDLMSSRLKFASMLFCREEYEEAAEVLTNCEGLLGPEVWQCCGHKGMKYLVPSTKLKNKLVTLSAIEAVTKHTMVCITFTKAEINCIPQHLTYEMLRSIEAEHGQHYIDWKNNVVIDCIPFLYYLQHLTYRELSQHRRAQAALHNLHEYTTGTLHGHIDTAFNMLGHCFELQNRLDLAWMCYGRSLEIYDRDNVSIWHAARILHQFLRC
ncbi:uncharacterized protein LOC128207812 [Mya arenaria]|uniref:uncharacterized protein LOC128207812 n=1 Tax=Mya arenaria TaxID=6604 RepID=UPI0022E2CA21|nr:uncharacterized protein LOC128207812 [Mya arenaria]